jgi:hypothetical protein
MEKRNVVIWEHGHAVLYDQFSAEEFKQLVTVWETCKISKDGTFHLWRKGDKCEENSAFKEDKEDGRGKD